MIQKENVCRGVIREGKNCSIKLKSNTLIISMLFLYVSLVLTLTGCDAVSQGPPTRMVPRVSFVTMQPENVTLTTELPGRITANRVAEIRPQISGLILHRLYEEGSFVEAGQSLYQIDPTPFEAALDNAKAALERAKANQPSIKAREARFKELLPDKAVSQQNYDDVAAALAQVKAEIKFYEAALEVAQINLNYTSIVAPISGRIGRSNITEGAIVTAYQPMALATIQQIDPIFVDVTQSTTDLLRLKRRQRDGQLKKHPEDQNMVDIILEDGVCYSNPGTLQFRDISVDATTGSVILRVLVPNPEGDLLPGMFVRTVIKEGLKEDAILVPQQGVSRDSKGNPYALVIDQKNKATFRPLTIDRAINDKWLVSAGLAPGDKVIVEGLVMLRPDTVVTAEPYDPTHASIDFEGGPGAPPQNEEKRR